MIVGKGARDQGPLPHTPSPNHKCRGMKEYMGCSLLLIKNASLRFFIRLLMNAILLYCWEVYVLSITQVQMQL